MSIQKLTRAAQHFLQKIRAIATSLTRDFMLWLLRGLLALGRQSLFARSGFVLPTAVLLLLVLTLTVGAIGYRTYTRTVQTIGERQQRIIFNAATPAIDRARSKLEYLFDAQKDTRFPGGIPGESQLLGMMLNDELPVQGGVVVPRQLLTDGSDPYRFPDETRLDPDGNGRNDNAWSYRADTNGDGSKDATVVYSIIFQTPPVQDGDNPLRKADDASVRLRANALQVRHAPLSNAVQQNPACQLQNQGTLPQYGWFPDAVETATLRKNFQIDAIVLPDGNNGTVTTLELHQDREVERGNKWGAWFRNDLEVFPGPIFNWNGAMHTEGSFIVGGNGTFTAYMISSPYSCLYTKNASETSAALNPGGNTFQGQFISGKTNNNTFDSSSRFHLFTTDGQPPDQGNNTILTPSTDSVGIEGSGTVSFALDPVKLQTENDSVSRGVSDPAASRDTAWNDRDFVKRERMKNESQPAPYVDDFSRADNRWGPKPEYNSQYQVPTKIGETIDNIQPLIGNDPAAGADDTSVGLDGYWERRARREGVRLIVGQRLELGDPLGWGGYLLSPSSTSLGREPMRPWVRCPRTSSTTCNEARQRRTLFDNLAAVQATAVYHSAGPDRDFPVACLATTVHPGTATTLDKSSTFENLIYSKVPPGGFTAPPVYSITDTGTFPGTTGGNNIPIINDFFRGRGTNGWEYNTPSLASFTIGSPMMNALENLANFAGDPNGGAPSFTPVQDRQVHPFPSMAMFGDFSMLRRVIQLMKEDGISYSDLSPADKTTLHTSACMMGMLAHNVDYLEKFNYIPPHGPQSSSITEPEKTWWELLGYNLGENYTTRTDDINLATTHDPVATSADLNPNLYDVVGGPPSSQTRLDLDRSVPPYATPGGVVVPPNSGYAGYPNSKFTAGLRGKLRLLLLNAGYPNSTPPFTTNFYPSLGVVGEPILAPTSVPLDLRLITPLNRPPFVPPLAATLNGSIINDLKTFVAGSLPNYYNPEMWVRLLERWRDALPPVTTPVLGPGSKDEMNQIIYLAQMIITKEQVARDRNYGFFNSGDTWDSSNKTTGEVPLGLCKKLREEINPITGNPSTLYQEPLQLLCSDRPRYPVLHSLFPAKDVAPPNDAHDPAFAQSLVPIYAGFEPHQEDVRSRDSEDRTTFYITSNNSAVTYQVVNPAAVALKPKSTDPLTWTLPKQNVAFPATANSNRDNLIKVCTAPCTRASSGVSIPPVVPSNSPTYRAYRIPLKDAAPYNGREMMSVRTLDVDLDLMRTGTYGASDSWLPKSGIIYAFREDAVSENEIVRPSTSSWSTCGNEPALRTNLSCQMKTGGVSAESSTDPPVSDKAISPKPVDYYADPDRRPHGVRLRRGASIRRNGDAGRGLSFISDSAVYIQGDFNKHVLLGGTTPLEEFTGSDLLQPDYGNFYTRSTLDTNFARSNTDEWRPSEILADAITVISDNFCDGSIEDGLTTAGLPLPNLTATQMDSYGCITSHTRTSYLNQDRPSTLPTTFPTTNGVNWLRMNPADSMLLGTGPSPKDDEGASPIAFDREYNPFKIASGTNGSPYDKSYYKMSNAKPLMPALAGTRVNSIIVSGIVPSRLNQSYGGMHNFPRFLEEWTQNKSLFMAGSFLQLNFSTYGTGPFDQDAYEPGTTPASTESIAYYDPPKRVWGYDVGLQYAPAGPVAQRFVTAKSIRSEFYNEPALNDPYIYNLCSRVPGANCPPPP